MVKRKPALSLDEIRSLSSARTVTATLECAGNRRTELMAVKPIPGEVCWGLDAIGTAEWRGIPLQEVLRAVGVEGGARYVAFTGLNEAQFEGEKVHFGSSITLEKALSPDVLLAYEMNEKPLAPEHGFPLHVIVPGYIGARSVKWLRDITLQEHSSTNPYQARDYKLFLPEVTAQTVDWSRGKTIEELILNAVITTPQEGEAVAGRVSATIAEQSELGNREKFLKVWQHEYTIPGKTIFQNRVFILKTSLLHTALFSRRLRYQLTRGQAPHRIPCSSLQQVKGQSWRVVAERSHCSFLLSYWLRSQRA